MKNIAMWWALGTIAACVVSVLFSVVVKDYLPHSIIILCCVGFGYMGGYAGLMYGMSLNDR